MKAKNNTKTLTVLIDEQYGKKGTPKRDKFDKGYETFKLGAMIHEARLEKGLTQEQLAENVEQIKPISLKLKMTLKMYAFQHCKKLLKLGLADILIYL